MISFAALLAAAALTGSQAQTTDGLSASDIGRYTTFAGMCSTLGWDSSRERAMALAQSFVIENDLDDAATAAEIEAGVARASAEIQGVIQALDANGDGEAFKAALKSRCDETANRLPALMNPTPQTEATFDAKVAELLASRGG